MKKSSWNIPLFNHLITFAEQKPQSYHVPGHRNGTAFHEFTSEKLHSIQLSYIEALTKIARLDVTELSYTDDLHDPQGAIEEAQQLAAKLYKADNSFFLVGGSTAGNIALILALCDEQDTIIIQRNVHKSIINGCKLAGVKVVFIAPEYEETSGLSVIPSLNTVEQAIKQYPEAKAVFLTNPNYYGLSVNLSEHVDIVHRNGMALLVDEAHGAHYSIAPHAPSSALQYGADAVVQSAHKTLPALTMSAMLHIQGNRINKQHIQQQLAIVQSSSPSYLLMAGLDIARAFMEYEGFNAFNRVYDLRHSLISWLRKESRFDVLELSVQGEVKQDPYRMLLYDTREQWNGYALLKQLETYGVWAEMSTSKYAVLLWHPSMTESAVQQLKEALIHIESVVPEKRQLLDDKPLLLQGIKQQVKVSAPLQFKRSMRSERKELPLADAIHMRCAEVVLPYPPGIPYLYEGECITAQHIEELISLNKLGARFQGSSINEGRIKVFDE